MVLRPEPGELEPGGTAHFTLYPGAAPDQDAAVRAIQNVPTQIYALGKLGNEHGRDTSEPITGIFVINGKNLPLVYVPGVE